MAEGKVTWADMVADLQREVEYLRERLARTNQSVQRAREENLELKRALMEVQKSIVSGMYLITMKQVEALLHRSRFWVVGMIEQGRFPKPCKMVGRVRLWFYTDILRWLDEDEVISQEDEV